MSVCNPIHSSLVIIVFHQAANRSSYSAGSKWPICQARQLQLNRAEGRGHTAMPIWGQTGKEHAAGSPQGRPNSPGFDSHVEASTSCTGALLNPARKGLESPF